MKTVHEASKIVLSAGVLAILTTSAGSAMAQTHGDALMRAALQARKYALQKPEMAKKIEAQTIRAMVIEQMAHEMAENPEFQKTHAEMMKNPAGMKMMEGCKATLTNPAEVAKVRDEVMQDPKAMEMITDKAMMMDMAKSDPEMVKMMENGMMKH